MDGSAPSKTDGDRYRPPYRRTGAHILVVDDDAAICRLVTRMLSEAGHRCASAGDARLAEAQLAAGAFDLVLCDIAMPGDSGLELLARVKARDPEMAIVMLTGMDSPQTAHLAFTLGADGYLLKPFDKNELLIQVAGALQRRVLEAENRHYREQLETTVDQRTAQLQKANARLKENEAAVKAKARELRDMNTALEVLLKKSEAVKGELEKHLSANTRKVIQPYLRKIAALGLTRRQLAYMELVESTLNRMVSPMIRHLDTLDTPLTPAELEVAHLIRQGRRTKEIADMLHLSVNTILTHRYHIRKKLGLLGKKANLYTALHQLQNQ